MNTLNDLKAGQGGVIVSVDCSSPVVRRRLAEMGLTPGTAVSVCKAAPFGDPIDVKLRGYDLSLRREIAKSIFIRPESSVKKRRAYGPYPGLSASTAISPELPASNLAVCPRLSTPSLPFSEASGRELRVALVGNPNSGKTTLFNALTGAKQHVGNWPGVTVEKKEGRALFRGRNITLVDLPGVYSLSPYSQEEIVTRDYILSQHPHAVINILDATNLERNLYLTTQLLELGVPTVLALNFMDRVKKAGDSIDCARLSQKLGVPVVPISARSRDNLEELLSAVEMQAHLGRCKEPGGLYGRRTLETRRRICQLIRHKTGPEVPADWAAIKLMEGDNALTERLGLEQETVAAIEAIAGQYGCFAAENGTCETMIADERYSFIENVVSDTVTKRPQGKPTFTERIDRVVTHKIFALPVFILLMFAMFWTTFGPAGTSLSRSVGLVMEYFAGQVIAPLLSSAPEWVASLMVDGVIGAVGSVLSFLPQISLLFLFLSILEDSGYMARAAFIMDRPLRKLGLSGKSFIPMLMGFGCTVPAVMSARAAGSDRDRRMTVLLVPFMSCSAKLPVYSLIASAFFPDTAVFVVLGLYVLGALAAIFSALLFRRTVFSGEAEPFVMELPPYRVPKLRDLLLHIWEKVRGFLVRAGTVILVMSVVLWLLQNFDLQFNMVSHGSQSILGAAGSFIAPIFKPLGFGTWQTAVALLTGVVAKESVVSSLALLNGFSLSAQGSAVAAALSGSFSTPAAALAFLVFVLLYVPCVASLGTMRRESGGMRWLILSILWHLLVAYAAAFAVFQLCSLLPF